MSQSAAARLVSVCGVLSLVVGAAAVRADDDALKAEIRAAGAAYVNALRRGNAAEIAAFWADGGVYVDADGKTFPARELAQDQFAEVVAFEDDAAPASVDSTIHFVGPTFAIEQGRARAAPGDDERAPRMQFMAAWVKQNDRWRLSLLREFLPSAGAGQADEGAPTRLHELQWLIGRWQAASGDAEVDLAAEWAAEKKFLILRFTARRAGVEQRGGVQRIAWDPVAGRMRSWTFHDDGGFSEALWHKEGDVWVAEPVGVLPDGRRTTAIHFWAPEGDGVCWFKSLQGRVDGQPADDMVLKFTREPAAAP